LHALLGVTFKDRARLTNGYDYTLDLESIKRIAEPFNFPAWQEQASAIINRTWSEVERAIYSRFGIGEIELHDHRRDGSATGQTTPSQNSIREAFWYCFLAAGLLLFILALMSVTITKRRTESMWFSVGVKIVIAISFFIPVSSSWVNSSITKAFYSSSCAYVDQVVPDVLCAGLDHWTASSSHSRHNSSQSKRLVELAPCLVNLGAIYVPLAPNGESPIYMGPFAIA
jgi:hypothetical protein